MRIVVIGAGLAGTTTAHYLAADGHEVRVLERAPGPAEETSFANAGMLTPSMAQPWNAPGVFEALLRSIGHEDSALLLRPHALPQYARWGMRFLANARPARYRSNTLRNAELARYSMQLLRELREQTHLEYSASERGTIKIFRSGVALDQARLEGEQLADHGVHQHLLSRTRLAELEPALAPIARQLAGGIHYPADESGDAHAFCVGLARHARKAGVRFSFETQVEAFEREETSLTAVRTATERFEADAFVLSAGSESPRLARELGLSLPVRPVKGYSITLDMEDWVTRPAHPVVDDTLHAAATPLGSRLRVAGTAELAGYDLTVNPDRVANLREFVGKLYPERCSRTALEAAEGWAGLRPMSSDGVPIIGASPIGNLFLNTGHGHLGWTLACGSARLVADVITSRDARLDPAHYALARF